MADYVTLQAAIDAGTTNMTVLRNNSKNDDGTSTYATGIDWFKFNNVTVNNIYSSGNSWIGFGASAEQLKVNRRDCAVWYEWKETGIIGITKFFKFRWRGYSHYSATDAASLQEFEFFLLDTGQIFLRFFTVPNNNNSGTKSLTADTTVSFSASSGVPCEYTFTPSDPTTGKGFTISTTRPNIDASYKTNGTAIITLANYLSGGNDSLYWTANTPTGTSVSMSASINNGTWQSVANGGVIQGMTAGQTYNLRIRAELATTDTTQTPGVSQIRIVTDDDRKIVVLGLSVPNISPVVGDIKVIYDGQGSLAGYGGPAEAFEGTFTPSGLTWKGNQNSAEHIDMDILASALLTPISYYNTKHGDEHVELLIQAVATLTNIHDI